MTSFAVQAKETVRILLIDDQSLTEFLIRKMIAGLTDLELHYCANPTQGVFVADQVKPVVILLDMHMGGMSGLELLGEFRDNDVTREVPILMLSVEESPESKAEAFARGANDYLVKLPAKEELVARLRYHADSYFNLLNQRRTEYKYRKLFENSLDAIFLTDGGSGRILDCNQAATRLMALPHDAIVGMHQRELHPPPSQEGGEDAALEAALCEPAMNTEVFVQRLNGEQVPICVSRTAFDQENRAYYQWTYRDISERQQLLRSLEEILHVAETANRAKSEFLATMSHEIRTPLNVIIGRADLMLETSLTGEQRQHMSVLNRSSEILLGLINDILDISKIESGRLELEHEPFSLEEVVREIGLSFEEPARAKGLTWETVLLAGAPLNVTGDRLRLRQVLFNLVGNAVKFTDAGSIQLKVKMADRLGEEGLVLFLVTDTGIGIAPEQQEIIFTPFSQADSTTTRRFGGTGLGLSICNRLVRMMGGRIKVKSIVGQGSTFFFTANLGGLGAAPAATVTRVVHTPVDEASGPDEAVREPGRDQDRRQPVSPVDILLVDDSEDNRLLVQAFFKTTPHRLEMAENGERAVEMFQAGRYDLVLMDLQMPVMDGFTATRRIREFERARGATPTPVVALSAFAMREDRERSREAGCDLHLTKPIKKRQLLEGIEAILAGRTGGEAAVQSGQEAGTGGDDGGLGPVPVDVLRDE